MEDVILSITPIDIADYVARLANLAFFIMMMLVWFYPDPSALLVLTLTWKVLIAIEIVLRLWGCWLNPDQLKCQARKVLRRVTRLMAE